MAGRRFVMKTYLTKDEYEEVMAKIQKAGLTKSAFVRLAVKNKPIREAPHADVPVLIREMRRNGQYFEQLLKYTESRGMPETPELRAALDGNRELELMVTRAYGL